jgi:hypothetical protein
MAEVISKRTLPRKRFLVPAAELRGRNVARTGQSVDQQMNQPYCARHSRRRHMRQCRAQPCSPVNLVRGPDFWQCDAALFREFRITDGERTS